MDASEVEVAWAEVMARWTDEAAHRAFFMMRSVGAP